MTEQEINQQQETKVLVLAGELWNEFLKCNPNDNDKIVVMENIHRIQDMMYSSLFIKEHGKL